jgi:hypothetical protein
MMDSFAIRPLILLLPLIVLVLALVFGGRKLRWLVGGFLCLLLVAVPFLFGFRTQSAARVGVVSVDMPGVHVNRHSVSPAPNPFASVSSSIDPNDRHADRARTDELNPDVFPTAGAAAVQCARRALVQYMGQAPAGDILKTVHVRVSPDPRDQARVITALKREYSALRFVKDKATSSQPAESDATQALLEVTADSFSSASWAMKEVYLVEARLTGGDREVTQQARVKNKSWVENSADWESTIFVDPPLLGSSPAEVKMNAIAVAAEQLEPYVLSRPGALGISPRSVSCRQFIENALRGGGFIRDEFLQRFEPGYGVVYRTALLVDASPNRLDALAGQYGSMTADERLHVNRNVVSVVGLVLLIVVVYLFLNAATKGYYVWSLRLGSVAIIAAGIYTVMKLT